MKSVPRRLLVLGGGSAGVELAQVVRRLGGEAVIVEGADRVLPREPAPLGKALSEALRRDKIELMLGRHATAALRDGDAYVLRFDGGAELRGIRVDEYMRAGEHVWAIGDVNGIWPLTHEGEYEGDVVAANIAGDPHPAKIAEMPPPITPVDAKMASLST
jgi:pyruvate/2-oxoglutarate dehydrogenase complex dihydrolipoamide dehydrogenase (E3) component